MTDARFGVLQPRQYLIACHKPYPWWTGLVGDLCQQNERVFGQLGCGAVET
jgi:hypothetical protein